MSPLESCRAALTVGLAIVASAACSFNGGGISDDGGDDAPPDGPPGDRDGDGVNDGADNCPDVPNTNQRDEDDDDVGNVCDNCPHIANADQSNDGESTAGAAPDDAGDVCDPSPAGPGNDILYFEGFDDPAAMANWSPSGGEWSISNGALRTTSSTALSWVYLRTEVFDGIALATAAKMTRVAPSSGPTDTNRAFGSLVAFAPSADTGAGYLCLTYSNPASPTSPSGTHNLITLRGAQPYQLEGGGPLGADVEEGETYQLLHAYEPGSNALNCRVTSTALPQPVSIEGNDGTHDSGFIGVRVQYVAADFPYVVVFAIPTGT